MREMHRSTPDMVVKEEIESVRARRVILDQLEGGPKTGNELRESIRKDMAAQAVMLKRRKGDTSKYTVTDPKLYFNTKHLESLGIITSRRDSKERIYSLAPQAVHPVRRALGISRPRIFVTSFGNPDEPRKIVKWLSRNKRYRPKLMRIFVEEERWTKGVTRNLDNYLPDDSIKKLEYEWHDLSAEIVGYYESGDIGNWKATVDAIETILLDDIPQYEVIVNLSMGTPTIMLALMTIATDYSLTAIHVRPSPEMTTISQVYPRE
jgi:DNA-binding transcriptional ArsR family regulator